MATKRSVTRFSIKCREILKMGGTRFIGVSLSRLLVKEGDRVTLFTRGKAPITQQLPGESEKDYADFSSKILHLKGDRKDFEFLKASLSAEGFDVVYDINGYGLRHILENCSEVQALKKANHLYLSLTSLSTTIADLEPHQIHSFYESVSNMIQAESDPQKRDEYLKRLMELPNQGSFHKKCYYFQECMCMCSSPC
ncbi:hypothetical protein ACSBR1_015820 [Camellia fascicularis]